MQHYQHKNKMKKIVYYIVLIFLFSCNSNDGSHRNCIGVNTVSYYFVNDSIALDLPQNWNSIDSTKYYSKTILTNKIIANSDTSCFATITIDDYGVYENFVIDTLKFFKSMQGNMESINHGSDSLIENTTKVINGRQVNFLKYWQVKNNRYSAHIAFLLPEKKQVEIGIIVSATNPIKAESTLDCIFTSLRLK
jgi:hypothetical protein